MVEKGVTTRAAHHSKVERQLQLVSATCIDSQ